MRRHRPIAWLAVFAAANAGVGCAKLVGLSGDYTTGGVGGSENAPGGEGGDHRGGTGAISGAAGVGRGGVSGNGASGGAEAGGGMAADGGTATGGDAGASGAAGASGGTGANGGTGASGGTGGTTGGDAGGGGAPTEEPPSCNGLPNDCGPTGDSSCCDSAAIQSGTFNRSNDARYPATVSGFRLDVYEVTVGRFRTFVNATNGLYRPEPGSGKNSNIANDPGWLASYTDELPISRAELVGSDVGVVCEPPFPTWTPMPGDNERRPINCVTWYLAYAFCIWDGGRLPTEAEWNFAAAGGKQQRVYPWSVPATSTELDSTHASYQDVAVGTCVGDGMAGCTVNDFVFVGSKPAGDGRWGNADLAGNVWEWTVDADAPYTQPCVDCATFAGSSRIGRGGGYISGPGLIRTDSRVGFEPNYRSSAFGIRCAR